MLATEGPWSSLLSRTQDKTDQVPQDLLQTLPNLWDSFPTFFSSLEMVFFSCIFADHFEKVLGLFFALELPLGVKVPKINLRNFSFWFGTIVVLKM